MKKLILVAATLLLISIICCTLFPFGRTAEGDGSCTTPPSGLVSWWGGDNNALDIIGTNDGTLVGGVTYAPGMVSQAFSFHGTMHDCVTMTGSTVGDFGSSPFSVDFWVNSSDDGSPCVYLVGKSYPDLGQGWDIRLKNGAIYVVGVNGWAENIISNVSVTSGAWHHIALIANGSDVILYIDGAQRGSCPRGAIGSTGNPFSIGDTTGFYATRAFNGLIDEVEIFNRALSGEEIAAIYNAGSAGKCRPCTQPPSNMVSWWKAEGNALDIIGTNHGTLVGGATYAAGMVGQAFSFDGTGDYITTADSPYWDLGSADFTIDGWINTDTPNNVNRLISAGSHSDGSHNLWSFGYGTSIGVEWGDGNRLNFCYHETGHPNPYIDFPSNQITITSGQWHHIACVRDGTTLNFYFDGAAAGTGDIGTVSLGGGTTGAIIGARYYTNPSDIIEYASGEIDEIEVFNRALSADEIAAIYNAGSAGKCRSCTTPPSGMVSWWGGDNNALDIIGTNHGTLHGGATYAAGMVGQAFSLDGAEASYVEIPDTAAFNPSGAFSVDGWFYIDPAVNANKIATLVAKTEGSTNYGWALYFDDRTSVGSAKSLKFVLGAVLECTNAIPTANWYHIAGVFDPSTAPNSRLYIDGALVASVNCGGATPNVFNVRIGAMYWTDYYHQGNDRLNGKADEVEFFNRALSADEIAAIYNAGSAGKCKLPCKTTPSGLVSLWKAENNTYDTVGTNHGTPYGTVTYDVGKAGQAFIFDGTSAYVLLNDNASLKPANITVDAWIKLSTTPTDNAIIFDHQSAYPSWYGYGLYVSSAGILQAQVYTDSLVTLQSDTAIQTNTWYHAAMTYDSATVRLFLNGVEENSTELSGNINYTETVNPTIGKRSLYNTCYFPGLVDEVAIFDRALSADEIAAIYNAGSVGLCPPPTEVWVDDNWATNTSGDTVYWEGNLSKPHTFGYDAFDKIQYGINNVSGSIVHVYAGTYYENIVLKDGVELLGNGSANTTIDGRQLGSVITANNLGNTTCVDGFTVTNGSASSGGGMYNYNASPSVTNCTFRGNSVGSNGGGIYNSDYSSPATTNCTFINNEADYGGGIANYYSSPTVTNCSFQSNSATSWGGGIYSEGSSSPTITDCTFQSNTATAGNGGGMGNIGSSPAVNNSTFQNNSAHNGGAMYNADSSLTITNCTFQNNSASNGGGMYNDDSSPTITNCTFTNNSVSGGDGGGMYNCDGSLPTITNCTFSNNTATSSGGGIANYYSSPTVTNCSFQNNSATGAFDDGNMIGGGGGMYNLNSSPDISICTFTNNSAVISGGMVNAQSSSPVITNCTFTNNLAIGIGGGMVNAQSSSPVITNCTFTNNLAIGIGGGMVNYINSSPDISICTFTNNSASGENSMGGGMVNALSSPNISYCTFTNNSASIGGGIYSIEGSSPNLTNCYFGNNSAYDTDTVLAEASGGGVYTDSGAPRIINCTFENNSAFAVVTGSDMSAYAQGGGIYIGNSSPVVANCIFNNNYAYAEDPQDAYAYGGGVYNYNSSPAVTSCTFWSNWVDAVSSGAASAIGGGMVNIEGSSPTISNCTFQNNSASGENGGGGGMVNYINSSPDISICTFTNNSASGENSMGGGMVNALSSPNISNCTFTNNSASGENSMGGGMVNALSSPNISNCTFTNNLATLFGGGMANQDSSPNVNNCSFTNNLVSGENSMGGGMYNLNSSPTISSNCTFTNNLATLFGGGMANQDSSPDISNCTFTNNSATFVGGGMYNLDDSSPAVTNCTFTSNSALAGGGMANEDSSPTTTTCTFQNNSALEVGGGMANSGGFPNISNCTFQNNLASSGGGMVNYNYSSTITNCTFLNNSATGEIDISQSGIEIENGIGGGMVNIESSLPTITNCTFLNNSAIGIGDGMYNLNSSPTVTNCILWDDSPDEIFDNSSTSTVTYSDVQGDLYLGTGNINASPAFVDVHLSSTSPCIDKGNNSAVPAWLLTDFEGDARILNGRVDMGVDETLSTTPKTASTTKLTSSTRTSNYGQSVKFTATVSARRGTPTGTVTFMDGTTVIASNVPLVRSRATFTTNALTPGSHTITAVYNGDTNFSGSTSCTLNQMVRKASTSTRLTSSSNPSHYGNSVTFTATIRTTTLGLGTPTGTVTFRDEYRTLGVIALDGSGQATYPIASLSRGIHLIYAVYSGDGNFSSSSRVLLQRVNR